MRFHPMASAHFLIHVYALPSRCHGDALGKTCLIVYPAPLNFPTNPTTLKVILKIRKKGPTLLSSAWCVPYAQKRRAKFFTGAPTMQSAISIRSPSSPDHRTRNLHLEQAFKLSKSPLLHTTFS